jgi:hypothetical protein
MPATGENTGMYSIYLDFCGEYLVVGTIQTSILRIRSAPNKRLVPSHNHRGWQPLLWNRVRLMGRKGGWLLAASHRVHGIV